MGTGSLPYFLLAPVLRLILSLERLHLWICLPAGMPRRLGAGPRGGETVIFYIQRVLGSGDFQHSYCNCREKSARACSALPTPPFAVCNSGRPFLFSPQHLHEQGKLAEECAVEVVTNFTWDESLNMDRVTLGRPWWKPHNGVVFP